MHVNIAKIENIAKRFTVFLGRTYCLGFLTIFSWNLWTRATSQLICIEIIINKVFNDLKPIVDLPVFLIPVFFPDVFVWNWSNNNNNTTTKIPQTTHLLSFYSLVPMKFCLSAHRVPYLSTNSGFSTFPLDKLQ